MIGLLCFVLAILASPFKSKLRLEAENAVLRHQLIVLRRRLRGRVRLTNHDRWFFIQLYRWFPSILKVLTIIRPETLVRWHRAGFRCYWRWKSRPQGGRPQIDTELRVLIRRMSIENPLWGAPRIHGELLKLGFEVAQSSVAKYMVKRRGPPSQGWRTFLRNHAPDIAAMDLFVVPTIGFDLLYAFVIVRLDRRDLVWINVTTNPTAEWVARQITEAFPWDGAPRYMIRDRDRIYGSVVTRRLRAMGIRDKPTAPASPWQNGFAERLIGSIRRECVDHIVCPGRGASRQILKSFALYYNNFRTHRSLNEDAPVSRPVQQSETFVHNPSSAGFTITTSGFRFLVHTPWCKWPASWKNARVSKFRPTPSSPTDPDALAGLRDGTQSVKVQLTLVEDTAVPKNGERSVGVAPQYASALCKTANCQTLVSLTLAHGEVPVMIALRRWLRAPSARIVQPTSVRTRAGRWRTISTGSQRLRPT